MNGGQSPKSHRIGLAVVRYGIGVVMVLGGIVMLVASPAGLGVDGFAMAVGGGLSVLLINFLFRLGVSGDREREREEWARNYFDAHGEWPEDEPKSKRRWTFAPGTVTLEQEQAEREQEQAEADARVRGNRTGDAEAGARMRDDKGGGRGDGVRRKAAED